MKTINKYSLIALMIALMAIVTGCTKNDGDPFGLYGVWHLTAAEDGTGAAIAIDPRTYIAFQNDIVKFYSNDGLVGTSESYGKLAQEGDHYLLTYTSRRDSDGNYKTVRWEIERDGRSLKITEHDGDLVTVRHYEKV